jgi:hypothetical protein
MKKTLLITSALVGLVASSAVAQTTVSGSLEIISRNTSFDGTAVNKQKSDSFLGRESQLNIQNKGKLNVGGLDYAAGFSLEFDGGQTTAEGSSTNTTISNENLYIDFINASSATTLTVGIDHIQNSKNTGLKTVTDFIDDVGDAVISSHLISLGAKTKEYMGVGIVQGLGASNLTASYFYAPNASNLGGGDTGTATNTTGDNAAYEYGVKGNDVFGVKGLALEYWKNGRDKSLSTDFDSKGKKYAVNYTYGAFTAGIVDADSENGTYTAGTNVKTDTRLYSVSYAFNKDASVSLIKGHTDISSVVPDEEYKAIQIGYNLGPVGIAAAYTDITDVGGVASQDAQQLSIRLSTKF